MMRYLLALLLASCTNAAPAKIELDSTPVEREAAPPPPPPPPEKGHVDAASDAIADSAMGPREADTPPSPEASPDGAIDAGDSSVRVADIVLRYNNTVSPGFEGVKCVDVPGPSQDTWITGWHVERRSGAHHSGVSIRKVGTPYSVPTRCSTDPAIDEGLLITTQPVLDFTLPGGAAILVPGGSSFILETHELNSAPEPVEALVDFALHTTPTPKTIANLFVLVASGSYVPPATTKTLVASCYPPSDMGILAITSHSHAHNTLVTGKVDGMLRYSSTTWAEPFTQVFNPPLAVKAMAEVTWACTVNNSTANTLTQCQNRDTCEMCELIGWAVMDKPWSCFK